MVPDPQNRDPKRTIHKDSFNIGREATTKRVVSPNKNAMTSLDRRMTVEKEVVDELLLVCGVIGTTTDQGNELVPVTDCLNWLQDLQRALRRDDDSFRPISILIGKWKVVEQKLLPLVMTCRYDTPIVLTVVKILVILTKPLAEETKRAGRMIIDTSGKVSPDVVGHQIKLRDNALEQSRLLLEYKRIVSHHPSHHTASSGSGLLSIFVSLLAEPLSRTGTARTDSDHLTIELVLHLFRNILSVEPLLKTSHEIDRQSTQLHLELIALLDKELMLEIFLVIASEIEARENAPYNLLIMELLHHLLKTQDPAAVARAKSSAGPARSSGGSNANSSGLSSVLAARLKQEKTQLRSSAGSRHGHFGGTWMEHQRDGTANCLAAGKAQPPIMLPTNVRRKNRKAEPFIGSGKTQLLYSRKVLTESPTMDRANNSLNKFCERFVSQCYGSVMKSLKNEFRRDSARLEGGDKYVFFHITWFFSRWWRLSRNPTSGLGHIVFTMDVFTFKLVLTSVDTYYEQKQFTRLAQAVALYTEMIHALFRMHTSKDNTEKVMARGLLDRIFYSSEPLDKLPNLLSRWSPGSSTREYLCDLVELCHVSLKLLESNQTECTQGGTNFKETLTNKLAKMDVAAAQFDVKSYTSRKIFSNKLVSMYVHLLDQYKINTRSVNHRIIAMFLRLERTQIVLADGEDNDKKNPLASRHVTFAPMLFNIRLLRTIETILNDHTIRNQHDFETLTKFCRSFLYRFMLTVKANPMLLVDCLFSHSSPHRYCSIVTNHFVSEELRMIAERDLLLEEQRQCKVRMMTVDKGAKAREALQEEEPDRDQEVLDRGETTSGNAPTAIYHCHNGACHLEETTLGSCSVKRVSANSEIIEKPSKFARIA